MPDKKSTNKEAKLVKNSVENSEDSNQRAPEDESFPIVGIGASAGGLEALRALLDAAEDDCGMAFIVVVHMSPQSPSLLPDLLGRVSSIPVSFAEDGNPIEPNHIYVIPPNKDISVFKGQIQLLEREGKGVHLPIDHFLRSLAQDQGSKAVAIILSGTGSDGTLGIKEIKANEGLVMVQSEESAGYGGMPRSAINTGLVDIISPPEMLLQKLIQYLSHPEFNGNSIADTAKQKWLNKIFAILRTRVGHDFSSYKLNTILRRISRRMGLNHIDGHKTYVRFLRENPSEVEALFKDLLIGVTNFFRDAESFAVLKTNVLPGLLEQLKEDSTFRAWIPGCSTGEEVYSLAIVLREILDNVPQQINLQLFGTDIDPHAIDKAREGIFPANIAADISQNRLKRFFIKEGAFYRIRKEIRDCVVFSVQDIIRDPPFSKLNLLCCRNLLIYLETEAQKKLIPLFHYTLAPDGVLVLGSSETIGGFNQLFDILDKKWKIYRRLEVPHELRQFVKFPSGKASVDTIPKSQSAVIVKKRQDLNQLTQEIILERYAPTAILTNAQGEILNFQGRTDKYLATPSSGPPTNNILDLSREGLRIELSTALRTAKSLNQEVTRKRLTVKKNGDVQLVDLHVCPIKRPKALFGKFLFVFEDMDPRLVAKGPAQNQPDVDLPDYPRISELERELQITRESHQTTIEELESSNEELKSTNEEIQSSNEELQSTNEELESSKEELQSLNEELQTVNSELQSKVHELSATQDDMHNLLNSLEIATIFVDDHMKVRRFTSEATTIVNLIESDIGRPLQHVVSNLNYDTMTADLNEVLDKLTPMETEVQTVKGEWFNMRIIPYRTTDNRIAGAVLTFSSIQEQKNAQILVNSIFDMNDVPMVVLDKNGKIIIINKNLLDIMNCSQKNIIGMYFTTIFTALSKDTGLEKKLEIALDRNQDFHTELFELETQTAKMRFVIRGNIIKKEKNFPYRILLRFIKQD